MSQVSASIRLRPTRIGFLVRPTDMRSVRKIMRANACLWGGLYNPIIPVFRSTPREWRDEMRKSGGAAAIARGYVSYFEPDVFVEAEPGLAKEVGLVLEGGTFEPELVSLDKFLTPESPRDWSEPRFGLNVADVLNHIYRMERRFKLRDPRPSIVVSPKHSSASAEAVFGVYPAGADTSYLAKRYEDVFQPEVVRLDAAGWLRVFRDGAETPLRVTRFGLDTERYWHHDVVIYIFDPQRPTDLIDLWNLRIEPRPIIAVPNELLTELASELRGVLKTEHRPVKGNPHGVMHHATIECARSLGEARAKEVSQLLGGGMPQGSVVLKTWRTPIWTPAQEYVHRDKRMRVTAAETSASAPLNDLGDRLTIDLPPLVPEFASRYGGHEYRWVNSVTLSEYGRERIATTLPFNQFDRSWPPIGSLSRRAVIGTEGWVFGHRFKGTGTSIHPLTMSEAIVGFLKIYGFTAQLSEPGSIAAQMLDHLEGLWGAHLLADEDTLRMLNKMAGGIRRRSSGSDVVEESFERRSVPVKDWNDLIARRRAHRTLPEVSTEAFTKRNVIRLGLETECEHCHAKNWHGLGEVDYSIRCDRCLKQYSFPEAKLRERNGNWFYRVVGPFAAPDFARGSYSALLALRFLKMFGGGQTDMTHSTAMSIKGSEIDCEVDFVALLTKDRFERHEGPALIFGEVKSLNQGDAVKPRDIQRLRALAQRVPGAILAIGVLRDSFTEDEKVILKRLCLWGRRSDRFGQPTNPVLLLTRHELLSTFLISAVWKKLGAPWDKYADYDHTKNVFSLCEATQRIYLNLPAYFETRKAAWQRKQERRKKKAKN